MSKEQVTTNERISQIEARVAELLERIKRLEAKSASSVRYAGGFSYPQGPTL